MDIDIERLKTDAEYWDEVAPEGAEFYFSQKEGNRNPAFFARTNSGNVGTTCDGESYHVFFNYWHDPIPRPTKPAAPEWVDGLPPVGCECEFSLHFFGARSEWEKCEFLARNEKRGVSLILTNRDYEIIFDSDQPRFRPIRTKEQRHRDELTRLVTARGKAEEVADAIIAAGWRKDA